MTSLGREHHRALINRVVDFYAGDDRVRAIAVFGSVATGAWHDLSDVDLDVVIEEEAVVVPADEVRALFGSKAIIALSSADSADVVLDTLEEISIRWHPLAETSPNIAATLRVVGGDMPESVVREAAEANVVPPEREEQLDALVRYAIGAWKQIRRGNPWAAVICVESMRHCLTSLRGRRDELRLDPARPEDALTEVLAEVRGSLALGAQREGLLARIQADREVEA